MNHHNSFNPKLHHFYKSLELYWSTEQCSSETHSLKPCSDDGSVDEHHSKISHRAVQLGRVMWLWRPWHNFHPHQNTHRVLMSCGWGRSYPMRDHAHQNRNVSSFNKGDQSVRVSFYRFAGMVLSKNITSWELNK